MSSVSTVYLLSKGLTYFQLNLLESLQLIMVFLLEIPTGIISDKFGHKVSFQVSMVFRTFFYVFLTITNSFIVLCIAFFILAISDACSSGSFITWYITKLQKENTNEENIKLFSNSIVLNSIAGIVAGFIGAIIATTYGIAIGYRFAAVLVVTSVIMLIRIPDTVKYKTDGEKEIVENKFELQVKEIIRNAKDFLLSNTSAQWQLILPLSIGYIAVSGIDNFWQPLFLSKQRDHLIWILGYAWVFIRLGTLIAGIIARLIRNHTKTRKYFPVTLLGCSVFVMFAALLNKWWLSAIAFALHATVWVLFSALTEGYLYKSIPETSKATTLSTISAINSIFGIIGMLSLALFADFSIKLAFFIASGIFILAFLFTIYLRRKK